VSAMYYLIAHSKMLILIDFIKPRLNKHPVLDKIQHANYIPISSSEFDQSGNAGG